MRTRGSWRNQERMWRYMGGKPNQAKRRPAKRRLGPVTAQQMPLQQLLAKYSALFDAGMYREAIPYYAAYLKLQATP